jgi:hypothetical protein
MTEISAPYTAPEIQGRESVELNFSLKLPDEMHRELMDGCRECKCSPTQFAREALESVLASRRLPGVTVGRLGARVGIAE